MSEVLFWQHKEKRDDPFLESSPSLAFYHPSLPRNLTKEESQTTLIAEKNLIAEKKLQHGSTNKESIAEDKLILQGKCDFLDKTNTIVAKELPTRNTPSPPDTSSSKLNESWPESERPSSVLTPVSIAGDSLGSSVLTPVSITGDSLGSSVLTPVSIAGDLLGSSVLTPASIAGDSLGSSVLTPASIAGDSLGSSVLSKDVEHDLSSLLKRQNKISSSSSSWTNDRPGISTNQPQSSSVLARYIHRFRHAAPRSREERFRDNEGNTNLWWLSSTPTRDTSSNDQREQDRKAQTDQSNPVNRTPIRETSSNSGRQIERRRTQQYKKRPSNQQYKIPAVKDTDKGSTSHRTSMDAETLILQEKAQHLLELSESSLLSEPIVSSEGIGSSSPSQPTSDDYIPPEISPIRAVESKQLLLRSQEPAISGCKKLQNERDDILYQWRLRRKMEEANTEGNAAFHRVRYPSSLLSSGVPSRYPPRNNMHTLVNPVQQTTANQNSLQDKKYNPQTINRMTEVNENVCTSSSSSSRSKYYLKGESFHPFLYSSVSSQLSTSEKEVKWKPVVSAPVKTSDNAAHNIVPHWHMSCDIIPCSHGNKPHHHTGSDCYPADEPINVQDEKIKSREVRVDSKEQNKEDNNSCDGTDYRIIKTQTLQKLNLRKVSGLESHKSNIPRNHQLMGSQRAKSTTDQREAAPSKQELGDRNDDGMSGVTLDQSKTTPETGNGNHYPCKIPADSNKESDMQIKGNQFISSAQSQLGGLRSSTDTDSLTDVEDSKQPRHVTDAIGQVVKGRLFGDASPKQFSTLPKENLKGSQEDKPWQDSLETNILATNILATSTDTEDEDKFKEDELLQILRRKRSLFENQLRLVDELISRKQGSG